MRPTDQLAVVTYDDDVDLLVPLGPPDTGKLATTIDGIAPGGCTNLSGGWLKGLEELNRAGAVCDRRPGMPPFRGSRNDGQGEGVPEFRR